MKFCILTLFCLHAAISSPVPQDAAAAPAVTPAAADPAAAAAAPAAAAPAAGKYVGEMRSVILIQPPKSQHSAGLGTWVYCIHSMFKIELLPSFVFAHHVSRFAHFIVSPNFASHRHGGFSLAPVDTSHAHAHV